MKAFNEAPLEYLVSEADAGTALEDAHLDELLDGALEGTFPASDPVAIGLRTVE